MKREIKHLEKFSFFGKYNYEKKDKFSFFGKYNYDKKD
jgi:hypothetical protein